MELPVFETLLGIFLFGLLITGIVFIGLVRSREFAVKSQRAEKARAVARARGDSPEPAPAMNTDRQREYEQAPESAGAR